MSNDVSTVSSWANPSDNCLRKAQTIVQEDLVQELNDVSYLVKSNTSGVIYGVDINSSGITVANVSLVNIEDSVLISRQ